MNNELKINMKVLSSDIIDMKLEDKPSIEANINGGIKEVDPIFANSPAYTITYNDITYWNNKSNFSGSYFDLTNKPTIPTRTSQLTNDSGFITRSVTNLENYTITNNYASVAFSGDYNDLINTPTIPSLTSDLTNDSGYITNTVDDLTNYPLSSSLANVATSGEYSDLLNTPSLSNVATTGDYNDLLNRPTLAVVASTGDYDDLIDKPSIPTKTSELDNDSGFITNANIPTKTSDLNNDSGFITNTVDNLTNYPLSSSLATVATSGSYTDLINKPTIPVIKSTNVSGSPDNNGFIASGLNLNNIVLGVGGTSTSGFFTPYIDIANTRITIKCETWNRTAITTSVSFTVYYIEI